MAKKNQRQIGLNNKEVIAKLDKLYFDYLAKHRKRINYTDIIGKLILKAELKDIE